MTFTTGTSGTLWNGAICPACNEKYRGHHECSTESLLRRIAELQSLMQQKGLDPTRACPCRPENGGSGVCGCVLNTLKVT